MCYIGMIGYILGFYSHEAIATWFKTQLIQPSQVRHLCPGCRLSWRSAFSCYANTWCAAMMPILSRTSLWSSYHNAGSRSARHQGQAFPASHKPALPLHTFARPSVLHSLSGKLLRRLLLMLLLLRTRTQKSWFPAALSNPFSAAAGPRCLAA